MLNKTLWLMIGISGSGKSYKSKKIKEQYPNIETFSADNYFVQNEQYHFDALKLKNAHYECKVKTDSAMRKNLSVIVDNTNLTWKSISYYIQMASIYGYDIMFFLFDVKQEDLPKLVERNVHGVPEKTIQRQFAQFKEIKKSLSRDMGSRFPGIKFTIEKIKVN